MTQPNDTLNQYRERTDAIEAARELIPIAAERVLEAQKCLAELLAYVASDWVTK